jgi:hypothetical protein
LCAACGPFASIMEGTLSVSWSEVSGATDGYRIYLDGVRAGWLFRSRALVPGAARGPHQVQVSALNSAGESPLSTAVSVVVP